MSFVLIVSILHMLTSTIAAPAFLNITAISAANGESTLECWQLSSPFTVSNQAGTMGAAVQQLGHAANASYAIIPAEFNGGAHNAPAVQYVAFLSGLAHITLPTSNEEVWIRGGKHGLILAADTAAVSNKGHITTYPSKGETTALQILTAGGDVPEHRILHQGPCRSYEVEL